MDSKIGDFIVVHALPWPPPPPPQFVLPKKQVFFIIIQTLVGPFLTLFGLFFATLSAETPFLSLFDEIILGKFLHT